MTLVDAPPLASLLIESMRDIGYTLEAATADIIDNAISAGAGNIRILVQMGEQPRIGFLDDGEGMTPEELRSAMRLGSKGPRIARARTDLGRFGLGLKTASFSQCRRVTVVTRKDGVTSAATWDLDHVVATDSWSLELAEDCSGIPFVDHLGPSGCLLLWEKMDRAFGDSSTDSRQGVRRLDETREHLELVFHRFLTGEPGLKKVQISINKNPLKPFDPFNAAHPATIRGPDEPIAVGGETVTVTCFTLPHHSKVTRQEWEHYGGKAGYLRLQGFYLYREKRLIVHGTWFGMARQTELTKLCRVRIDTPNSLDEQWHIDIKKAYARPPAPVRERLQNLLNRLGAPSRDVYTRRGHALHVPALPVWTRRQQNGQISYAINPSNPAIAAFEGSLDTAAKERLAGLLQVISSGIPLDAIYADFAGMPADVVTAGIDEDVLASLVREHSAELQRAGIAPGQVAEMLRAIEPFRSNWERVAAILGVTDTRLR